MSSLLNRKQVFVFEDGSVILLSTLAGYLCLLDGLIHLSYQELVAKLIKKAQGELVRFLHDESLVLIASGLITEAGTINEEVLLVVRHAYSINRLEPASIFSRDQVLA